MNITTAGGDVFFETFKEREEADGQRPLHVAAKANAADACRLLIAQRCDVAAACANGFTPLIAGAIHARDAAATNVISAVCGKELVDRGDRQGRTAMHWAEV